MRGLVKTCLALFGIDARQAVESVCRWSVLVSLSRSNKELVERLRQTVPDISNQETSGKDVFNEYWEVKRRGLQAFQCRMMLKAIEAIDPGPLVVVDIGDSAGTHMLYLKELTEGKYDVETISVNLDPKAIERIRTRGLNAVLCRAEDLDLGDRRVDLFTSFQMVEHLHNPAIFFRRLAKRTPCKRVVVTVPYLKESRVGLHHLRTGSIKPIFAEEEHIFELNPEDWTLLMRHAGWKVIYSDTYYQYPKRLPFASQVLSRFWRAIDYEGFWGAILEQDTALSDCYQDWED